MESSSSVSVFASVGVNDVTINGYTAPNSRVELTSTNTFAVTYSNTEGYFEFNRTILPKNYSELCLNSTDENKRPTAPVCIPPPPRSNYHTDIGPILLPPTLTLDNANIKPDSTVITSGQSIPNSTVNVYFYKVDDNAKSFVKDAYAYALPAYTVNTDDKGFFNLNLPTAYSSNYRLYAAANYNENLSPKSNTLLYHMPTQINYWIFILPLFFLALIGVISFLLVRHSKKHPRFLPALRHFEPALYPEKISRSLAIPK